MSSVPAAVRMQVKEIYEYISKQLLYSKQPVAHTDGLLCNLKSEITPTALRFSSFFFEPNNYYPAWQELRGRLFKY